MNQAPPKVKKEIYSIKEIHAWDQPSKTSIIRKNSKTSAPGVRFAKLEFLPGKKVKARTPRNNHVKIQILLV